MIGTLAQMASTLLNNIYTHKEKKTRKQVKAAFQNIYRSAAARIAATTLWVFKSFRFIILHSMEKSEVVDPRWMLFDKDDVDSRVRRVIVLNFETQRKSTEADKGQSQNIYEIRKKSF